MAFDPFDPRYNDARIRDKRAIIMGVPEMIRSEGRAEAYAIGLLEGRAQVLVRVLEMRFGALPARAIVRFAGADIDTLDHWLDRALSAPDLETALELSPTRRYAPV